MTTADNKVFCWVHMDTWAGQSVHRAELIQELPKSFKVKLVDGAYRHPPGSVIYPPKWSVTFGTVVERVESN